MAKNHIRTTAPGKFLIIALLMVSIACNNDPVFTNSEIVGDWEWFQTFVGRPPLLFTPESTGETKTITFEPFDSVRYYQNGVLVRSYPYRLEYEKEKLIYPFQDSILVLVINTNQFSYFSISNDTLIIDDTHWDGGTSFYKRID